jgi:hypothetical protein
MEWSECEVEWSEFEVKWIRSECEVEWSECEVKWMRSGVKWMRSRVKWMRSGVKWIWSEVNSKWMWSGVKWMRSEVNAKWSEVNAKWSEGFCGVSVAFIYSYEWVLLCSMWLLCLRICPYIVCSTSFVLCCAPIHLLFYMCCLLFLCSVIWTISPYAYCCSCTLCKSIRTTASGWKPNCCT